MAYLWSMESMPCPCEPLTGEWVEWLSDTLSANRVDDSVTITVEHCATATDEPDFRWHVLVADGKAEVALGPADDAAPNRVRVHIRPPRCTRYRPRGDIDSAVPFWMGVSASVAMSVCCSPRVQLSAP